MPFKSEKQRKWMHANEPEMAKQWEKKEKKMKRVKELIKKMVREELAEMKESKLNEFNKAHFLNLIKQEIESLKGQIAYAKDKVNYKGTADWEKKEFKAVLKDKVKDLSKTIKHYKRVQKLKEGKLTEKSAISLNLWIKEFERLAKKNRMKPVDFVKKHISKRKGMDNEVVKNVLKHFQKNEGKLTEVKEPLWTKETVKDAIKQIKKGLKNAVPYLDGIGTGFGGESIIGKISLDDKKTWTNNILENSRWALIHFHPDGTLDTIRMHGWGDFKTRKKVPILRKSKNKSIKQAVDRMGKYFTVVRLKHPDTKGK